jgi:hypothetical protein
MQGSQEWDRGGRGSRRHFKRLMFSIFRSRENECALLNDSCLVVLEVEKITRFDRSFSIEAAEFFLLRITVQRRACSSSL